MLTNFRFIVGGVGSTSAIVTWGSFDGELCGPNGELMILARTGTMAEVGIELDADTGDAIFAAGATIAIELAGGIGEARDGLRGGN